MSEKQARELNTDSPVPFRASNYLYKITLATVDGADALDFESRVYCEGWDDAQRLIDMWMENNDYPSVKVETEYRPRSYPGGGEE